MINFPPIYCIMWYIYLNLCDDYSNYIKVLVIKLSYIIPKICRNHLEMKLLIALVILLSALFTVGVAQSMTGTCTSAEQTAFVTNDLGLSCALSLVRIDPSDSAGLLEPNVASRSEILDTVCTAECGGALVQYFQTCCNDSVLSQGLVSWCTPTGNVSPGRDRCYFALPPVFNLSSFSSLADDCVPTGFSCPSQCSSALREFVGMLGCCYQSFYNNPTFIQAAQAAGLISAPEVQALSLLSNDFVWNFCDVDMPDECSGEPFPRTTTTAPINIADACPMQTIATTSPTTRSTTVTTTTSSFIEEPNIMTNETSIDTVVTRITQATTQAVVTAGALATAPLDNVLLVNTAVIATIQFLVHTLVN